MRFVPVLVLLLAGCPLDISPESGSIPSGPPPGPGGGTISYQSDLQPLFDDTCVVCHGSAGGLDLSSRDALLLGGNSGALVLPGDPDNSILVLRVEGSTLGDQMPLGLPELTTFEIALIRTWILEGALDN